jgi:hypothetical protein
MIVRPQEIAGPLGNPWMGWGLWAGPTYFDGTPRTLEENTTGFGDDAPLFDWVLVDWMWADLEPEEGRFHWEDLDAIMDYWAIRGKQINLRVWVTDDPGWNGAPGADAACPDWVYDAGLKGHAYTGEGGAAKREPNYLDPSYDTVYLPRLRNLLAALADRYDRPDNPFNFIGNMSYGQWGEWHTMWSKYPWPSRKAKHDRLAGLVNLYADTFHHVDLAISFCVDTFIFGPEAERYARWPTFHDKITHDDPADLLYRQGVDVALERGYLLGRHGFIDGLGYTDRAIMEREWRKRAFYAEANWGYLDVVNHETHGTVDENIDVMLEWHSNYAHFYMDAASYRRAMAEDHIRFARGLEPGGLGYRLALTQAAYPDRIRPGQLLLLRQRWLNHNVGRCYRRHPLRLYLVNEGGDTVYAETDGSFDPTAWVRGETYELISVFHLPKHMLAGSYDVRIGLVDWEDRPALRLGIAGDDGEKRYRLGTVTVDSAADRSERWDIGW